MSAALGRPQANAQRSPQGGGFSMRSAPGRPKQARTVARRAELVQ